MNTNSYFTVEILTSGSIRLYNNGVDAPNATFYYWINKEPNAARDNYDGSVTTTTGNYWIKNLIPGDKIKFYRAETTRLNNGEVDTGGSVRFGGDCNVNLSGNLASLIGFSETLPTYCFRYLFYSWNIVDASRLELPWDTLTQSCFIRLFFNNQKLLYSPKLPATNLAANCYQYMFYGDSSLVKSPELRAKSLKSSCYGGMFAGCTSLDYIVCLAEGTSISIGNFTQNVAATGTFIKHPDATWVSGNGGIPSGWTVKNMNPSTQTVDYNNITAAYVRGNISLSAIYGRGNVLLWGTPVNNYATQYFTAEIITSGTLWYMCSSSSYKWTLEYSKNNGTWYNITADTGYGIGYNNKISVNAGDKIRFRKTGTSSSTVAYSYLWSNTCTYELYGNIMSLAYGDNFIGQTTIPGNYYFVRFCSTMNSGETNTWLKSVENLVLPATTLTSNCYNAMFSECTQITKAPVLPATTLVSHCYDAMFGGCIALRYIKAMFTTTPGSSYTDYWVVNIPSGGTFVKNSNATWNVTGNNGVPSGWTIEYA